MPTITIEVKCDSSTLLYWRELGGSSWDQLAENTSEAPTITATESTTTTFRFVQYSGSTYDVIFKDSAEGTPQSLPASVQLGPDDLQDVYFSRDSQSPRWYAGYIKVPVG